MNKFSVSAFLLFSSILGFFIYSGIFTSVHFKSTIDGPFYLIYQKQSSLASNKDLLLKDMKERLGQRSIDTSTSFVLEFEKDRRYMVGFLLNRKTFNEVGGYSLGYEMAIFPVSEMYITEYPNLNFVSQIFATLRIDAAFESFSGNEMLVGPILKTYDNKLKILNYRYPTENITRLQHLW